MPPLRIAELVIKAGRVVPGAGEDVVNGAVALVDGQVLAVGTARELEARIGRITRVIEVPRGVVLPGLADAHGHLLSLGEALESLDLTGTSSLDEVLTRVSRAAEGLPPGQWLVGRGWDQNDWPAGAQVFPDRARLDAVAGDRPVVLERIDGHAVWASRGALAAAGLAPTTADPPGGRMLRRADGSLTGVLIDAAMTPLWTAVPAPDDATLRRRAQAAARFLASKGHTGLHDMGESPRAADLLLAMGGQAELPLRLHVYLDGNHPDVGAAIALGPRKRGLVSIVGVKFFLDGALGSRGAALQAAYTDEPGQSGLLLTSPEDLEARARVAMQEGLGVAVHAIGDRANRIAIDVLGALARELPSAPRPRIEHVQIVAPDDLPRIGASGLVASMQPLHSTSDMPWAPQRLGQSRLAGAYAWRSVLAGGATLAFGSDCPVETPDPLQGLYSAVTRRSPAPPRNPQPFAPATERLDLRTAMRAFTRGAAEAVGEGSRRGSLAAGRDGDVTVLESDPFAPGQPAEALLDARVAYAIVAGAVAFGD